MDEITYDELVGLIEEMLENFEWLDCNGEDLHACATHITNGLITGLQLKGVKYETRL